MLQTKLNRPPITIDQVIRTSIIERLDKNIHLPLTLVSAPAGYGKSITISQWLDHTQINNAWLSLDDEHNDLQVFLNYIVSAYRMTYPGALNEINAIIDSSTLPPNNIIEKEIINGFNEIQDDFILVLDDYHNITNHSIHELINELIRYAPSKMHLVIISRRDPPLKLRKLYTYQRIHELRIKDLSFAIEETQNLFKRLLKLDLNYDTLHQFNQKTEGWIVGLRMIAHFLNTEEDVKLLSTKNLSDWHAITEFFMEEVLATLPSEMKEIMTISAYLDRFCEELINYILEADKGTKFLDFIIKSNPFVIPLDFNSKWFRYHQIFRDVLKKSSNLPSRFENENKIYLKASQWFEMEDLYTEALDYVIQANEIEKGIEIINRHRHELLDHEKFSTLKRWLNMLPDGLINKYASLLLTQAAITDSKTHGTGKKQDLLNAKKLIDSMDSKNPETIQLLGEYKSIMSIIHYMQKDYDRTLSDSSESLKMLSPEAKYCYNLSVIFKSLALLTKGKIDESVAVIENAVSALSTDNHYEKARLLALKCTLYVFQGNIDGIITTASIGRPVSLKQNRPITIMWYDCFLSIADYESNNLSRLEIYRKNIPTYRYAGRPYFIMHIYMIQLLSNLAQNNMEGVDSILEEMRQYYKLYNIDSLFHLFKAMQVEVFLRLNKIDLAMSQSKGCNFDANPPLYFHYIPQLTQIKLLILSSSGDFILALRLLESIIQFGRTSHHYNLLIQALALESILYEHMSEEEKSKKVLMEALKIAEPLGYKRTFLDLGSAMYNLLTKLDKQLKGNYYVKDLINVFQREESIFSSQSKLPITKSNSLEIETLTEREVQLLILVSRGFRNKEIALELNLSEDTIKKYLYWTYQKLNVHNRNQAINKAKLLGYLS